MLCSSTSLPRYPAAAAASGAAYLIHPPYPDGLQRDYSFNAPDAGQVNYVQDQCSIHSSAPLAFAHPAGTNPIPSKKFWDQASTSSSAPDSAGQSKSSQPPSRASGRGYYRSTASTPKKRKRVATVAQRRAANIRERRRMFNLNEAFDKLRRKVPTFAYEKRLSRIETLRLAITYISFMDQVIRNDAAPPPMPPTPAKSSITAPSCEPIVTPMAPDAGAHHRRADAHFREASVCW